MDFSTHWKSQLDSSMQEFAQLAATTDGIDFRYGWLATALLWPIRQPIQEFDGDAMDAVREITGNQAKHILKVIQSWEEDPVSAARNLAEQAKATPEIGLALSAVMNHFDASTTFAGCLAQVLVKTRGGGDVYNISEQIKAALVNIGGVMNIQSLAINLSLSPVQIPLTSERRNELALLQKVRTYWVHGVLERSLYETTLLELDVQPVANAVDSAHPWEMLLDLPDRPGEDALPPGVNPIDIFNSLEKEGDPTLLILGAPGSGKTITLLELARDMLTRAEQQTGQPLPVVLNLATWGVKRQPFAQWLLEDLNQKYQIPKKIGQKWLDSQMLLLLLDGLDEVRADQRDSCVEEINSFRKEHGLTPIVVCSRIQEYEVLKQHLQFQRAIRLLPLTMEQVETYIKMVGEPLANLNAALLQDATLRELASSPLMLNVMSLAYRDLPAQTLLAAELQPSEARQKHLFGTYVKRMFQRRIPQERYTPAQTLSWLSWLAQKMLVHNQSLFSLENLQPTWLSFHSWGWLYLLLSRLIAGTFVTGAVLVFWTFILGQTADGMLLFAVIAGLVLAGIDALWLIGKRYRLYTTYYLLNNKASELDRMTSGFWAFTWVGGSLVVSSFLIANGSDFGVIIILLSGVPFAFIFGRRVGLENILFGTDVRTRENLNYSWGRFGRVFLYGSLIPGVIIFSISQLMYSSNVHSGFALWDTQAGTQVRTLTDVTSEVAAIDFGSDAKRLVSLGRNGSLQLWDEQSGKLVKTLQEPGGTIDISAYESQRDMYKIIGITTAPLHVAVFSPDSTRLVTAGADRVLRFWNGETGQSIPIEMGQTGWISTGIFSPSGNRLVTVDANSTTQLRDGKSGVLIQPQMGRITDMGMVIYSSDGNRLIMFGFDGPAQLWDGQTGEPINIRMQDLNLITISAAFNAEGTRLATGTREGPPQLWNAQTGELIKTLEGNTSGTVAFSKDGKFLVTAGLLGTTQLWDGLTGDAIQTLEEITSISGSDLAMFSQDGMRLLTTGPTGLDLWDVQNGTLVATLKPDSLTFYTDAPILFNAVAFSPDGSRIVTTTKFTDQDARLGLSYDRGIQLWDGKTGESVRDLGGHSNQVDIVSFSADGTRLITVGSDGIVQLWDTETGRNVNVLGKNISIAQLSPGGMHIVTSNKLSDSRGWTFLAIIGVIVGSLVGFRSGVVATKTRPNQGIHLTAANSVIVALFVSAVVFLVVFIAFLFVWIASGASLGDALTANFAFDNLMFFGVIAATIGLLVFFGYGGMDVLCHYILRALLVLQHRIPIRYARFLNYASERIFLQKVGGSYIFTHRLLLEYFAALDKEEIAELTK